MSHIDDEDKRGDTKVKIIVAVIGAVAVIIAAVIGILPTILDRFAATTTPTPSPVTDKQSDLYDDFSDTRFDGSFNPDLWQAHPKPDNIAQQDGVLVIRTTDGSIVDLNAKHHPVFLEPMFLEANLMLDTEEHNGAVRFAVASDLGNGEAWGTECSINPDGYTACFFFWFDEQLEYTTPYSQNVEYGTWHTLRIELDPPRGLITYYIDGYLAGSHISPDPEIMMGEPMHFWVGVFGDYGAQVTAYVDNVHFGPLTQ